MLELQGLAERFRETANWCALNGLGSEFPYDGQLLARKLRSRRLRSPELRPAFQERLQNRMSSNSRGGRFVVYAPEENLADGAAEVMSLGYFDADNVPPWDTWVAMVDRYLLAWVRPQLIKPVDDEIEVNPEECIMWADNKVIAGTAAAQFANTLETNRK